MKSNKLKKEFTYKDLVKFKCFHDVYIDGDALVRFKVKLEHYNLSQQEFFTAIITAYGNNDPLFEEFITKHITSEGHAKWKLDYYDYQRKFGLKVMKDFGLSEDEKESIYDVLEEDDGDDIGT